MRMQTVFILTRAALNLWRCIQMARNSMSMVKTIGIGLATGVAVAAIASKMSSSHKRPKAMKKRAHKMVDNLGVLMDDVGHMFR